jgi:hypothetical protein
MLTEQQMEEAKGNRKNEKNPEEYGLFPVK